MSERAIGRLERVPLREVWKNEAADFTTWLQENIEILNEILELELSSPEREQSAGTLSVDIVAEDEDSNPVIIENQLGKSDHDHLGKVVTYLATIGAKTAIWIVADPRPEHITAISWLNESQTADFYLLKVEAVRIGDSPPAPLLTLITGPSTESREVGATKQELKERHVIRQRFWGGLLEVARDKTNLHANISPGKESWIGTGAGKYGLSFNYVVLQHETRVELYIDRGKDADDENAAIFDALFRAKPSVEQAFGGALDWQRLESKRACRISFHIGLGGLRDEDKWPEVQNALVDAMIRLEAALRPNIKKLSV